jgi:NAD(P) transhydrogenase subunit beta
MLLTPTLAAIDLSLVEQLIYMVSAFFFVTGLKKLTKVKTARAGNRQASIAMLVAVVMTVYLVAFKGQLDVTTGEAIKASLPWMIGGLAFGGVIGIFLAKKVEMTDMPELVAFFNGMGGASSMFVALATAVAIAGKIGAEQTLAGTEGGDIALSIGLSILIGSVTLTGSLVAYAKLSGKMWKNRFGPVGSQGLNIVLALLAIACVAYGGFMAPGSMSMTAFIALTAVALFLGVGLVVPIGGADMPVVISLLNSYSGIAAAMTGFILHNNLLIVAGMLVGAAGLILTQIMCKAMNRSLSAVLFAKFGEEEGEQGDNEYTGVTSTSAEELAPLLEAASKVIIVPGYGLAVAQAQHKCRELGDLLEKQGIDVCYGIHPVAGRMPGHMNVLLAEADVDYDKLYDLDQINGEFKNAEITIVIGANDVCNPEAYDNPQSPIAGMPVLDVWDSQTVIVIKRSLSPGYAGIKNPLFERDNCLMFFGDAKQALEEMVTEFKDL